MAKESLFVLKINFKMSFSNNLSPIIFQGAKNSVIHRFSNELIQSSSSRKIIFFQQKTW